MKEELSMKKGIKIKEDIDKPVYDHLSELRTRLIIIFSSMLIATIFLYTKTPFLIKMLSNPIYGFRLEFAYFTFTGAFTARLKLAFIATIIIVSPLAYQQLMAFIGPGLTKGERRLVYNSIFFVVPVFITGAVLGFIFIVPKVLSFLISYGSSYMDPMLSGEKYLSFVGLLCVLIGIISTIPVIMIFLGKLGILSSSLLKKVRKFIIFTVLLGEGIIAGDLTTFIMIGVPFIIVYEASILIVIIIEKRRKRAENRMLNVLEKNT